MHETVTLTASDGHQLPAYLVRPQAEPKAGVVIYQEAFGVTPHIKRMCAWLAENGYLALAPDMFARSEPDPAKRVLSYSKEGLNQGRDYIVAHPKETWLLDCTAAIEHVKGQGLKTGTLGYCWGGSLSYFSASQVSGVSACVGYYGGMMADLAAAMQPPCPVQIHLATLDRYIPVGPTSAAITRHVPKAELYIYDADHGFNRDDGVTYSPPAATLARERTLRFFRDNLKT